MKIDLESGVFIEIGGELGRYNSLPIDSLIKIASHLQELVFSLAKYDLPSNEPIDLNNFVIELVGFQKGSAVPKFAFTQRSENRTGLHWEIHRGSVNEKFEKLVEISHSGDYQRLLEIYPEPSKRNHIVEDLYSFVNSFGNSPVSFVEYDEAKETSKPIFKVHRFKPTVKNQIIGEILEIDQKEDEPYEAVGKIKISKRKGKSYRKIINAYSTNKFSLEYAPSVIVSDNNTYVLKFPLRCQFTKQENFFIIQSEMLGIIGTGLTEDDAEFSFAEEFDYIFQRLSTLESDSLTNRNFFIKSIITQIVEKVE